MKIEDKIIDSFAKKNYRGAFLGLALMFAQNVIPGAKVEVKKKEDMKS